MPENNDKFHFSKAADYRIKVQGQLEKSWSDKLADMTITHELEKDYDTVTILEGYLRDQAALVGILNTLYELHYPVLTVELVKTKAHDKRKNQINTLSAKMKPI